MKYDVIVKHDRRTNTYTAFVPALAGCVTQADTKADALKNVRAAIREYPDSVRELARRQHAVVVEVR